MNEAETDGPAAMEVRTYFVRERNALVARADFGELYVDYYLHQGQHGYQHTPQHNELLKQALAAQVLHCASRPRHETVAWTIHFQDPLLNLFSTGNNPLGTIVGQIFTENVKDKGHNLFLSDVVSRQEEPRRSAVEFTGSDPFRAVEHLYRQSEQRPARYFQQGPEDFVMISAQPGCDLAWLEGLDEAAVGRLDEEETLSLLERRSYRWECGCTHERMLHVLAPIMRSSPEELFGEESLLRMSCPRCGARYTITREALEAYLATTAE